MDQKGIRRLSSGVNHYLEKLFLYPGKLFPGFNLPEDIIQIRTLLDSSPNKKIILEFGSGSGGHLLSLAELKPESLLIGFEIRFKRAVRTLEKGEERGISNVYIFRGRGEHAGNILEDRKVDEVYINFPDPWEKKRWRKHRILSPAIITMVSGLLEEGGVFSIKTDHQEYFASFLEHIEEYTNFPFQIEYSTSNLEDPDVPEAAIKTEFEQLFRNQGKPVCYIRMKKKSIGNENLSA
jgi:tRNA (guanine-N7-)-methyltransferase